MPASVVRSKPRRSPVAARRGRPTAMDTRAIPSTSRCFARRLASACDHDELLRQHPVAALIPFSTERKFMAAFHRTDPGLSVSVKGAPRRILTMSSQVYDASGARALDEDERRRLMDVNFAMAAAGLRVLAVATGTVPTADASALQGLTFVGFLGLLDPPARGRAGHDPAPPRSRPAHGHADRRPAQDGGGDRPPTGHVRTTALRSWTAASSRAVGRRAASSRAVRRRLQPRLAGAQAADRPSAAGARRDRRDAR